MGVSGVVVDKQKIIDALWEQKGVVKNAAKSIGINKDTIYDRAQFDPDIQNAIDESRARRYKEQADEDLIFVEKARQSLLNLLEKNDVTATLFVMRVRGGWLQQDLAENKITVIDATAKHRETVEGALLELRKKIDKEIKKEEKECGIGNSGIKILSNSEPIPPNLAPEQTEC